jgi:S-adenosyl-L-methionine hydrolase (adenosine-forming)
LGLAGAQLAVGREDRARLENGRATGVVVTIDHFGNLLTNLDADWLERVRNPVIEAGGQEIPIHRTYGDVPRGQYLALANSFGVLEIARAEMSAAAGLGLDRGAPVVVRPGRA